MLFSGWFINYQITKMGKSGFMKLRACLVNRPRALSPSLKLRSPMKATQCSAVFKLITSAWQQWLSVLGGISFVTFPIDEK